VPTQEQLDAVAKKIVRYEIPGMDRVQIRSDIVYRTGGAGPLLLDVYRNGDARLGAVVLVSGFPDPRGWFRKMGAFTSWARLMAMSGVAAVAYSNEAPPADLEAVLGYIEAHGSDLGIDPERIALWACSGHVPTALGACMKTRSKALRCAALCYGFMLDFEGSTAVRDASAQVGFANPNANKSIADLPKDLPLLVVRAGKDQFVGLNRTIDRFVADVLAADLPLILMNHASAPHAFDLDDEHEASREMIRRILAFLETNLRAR
jgi:hypothetical protein